MAALSHDRSGVAAERARLDALPTPLLARAATPFLALSGTANVVMQLSRAEVGHGVRDSPVAQARLFDAPERRRRTTVGFLAVAVHGSAAERAAYRRAVNRSHGPVRSGADEEPAYTAFDPELQRWVGACLYRMFEEAHEAVHGPLGAQAEAFYAEGVVLGGMLQMPATLWPASRAAFEDYWRAGLGLASIDETTRAYLMRVVRHEYGDRRVSGRRVARRLLLTTGFLPPELREQMHLPWSVEDQARFQAFTSRAAALVRHLPGPLRGYPFNAAMRDVRRRLRADRDLLA